MPLSPHQLFPLCFLFLYRTLKLSTPQNILTQDDNPVGASLTLPAITSLLCYLSIELEAEYSSKFSYLRRRPCGCPSRLTSHYLLAFCFCMGISQNCLTQDDDPAGAPLAWPAITSLLSVLVYNFEAEYFSKFSYPRQQPCRCPSRITGHYLLAFCSCIELWSWVFLKIVLPKTMTL